MQAEPADRHSRVARLVWRVLAGVLLVAGVGGGAAAGRGGEAASEPVAEVEVRGSRPLAVGVLATGVPINPNRAYTFEGVPAGLHGLAYLLHEHKNPAAASLKVRAAGVLYLCLWAEATPARLGLEPGWEPVATLTVGQVATEPWHVYRTRVEAGRTLDLPVVDRWGCVVLARRIHGPPPFVAAPSAASVADPHSPEAESADLAAQIARHRLRDPAVKAKLTAEACRVEALIRDSDRTPADVVLRRTRALLHCLQALPEGPDLRSEAAELDVLAAVLAAALAAAPAASGDPAADLGRFRQACALRRRVAFRNPLLAGLDRIVFLKHDRQARGASHMVDQYLGFNARPAGGVYVLERPFGANPTVRDLLADATVANGRLRGRRLTDTGSFIALDLDFDASRLAFAWTEAQTAVPAGASYDGQNWRRDQVGRVVYAAHYYYAAASTYHVFVADLRPGGDLRQLTDGPYNDTDPCFLPNGRLAFVSERAGGNLRCGDRPLPTATLHAMRDDGSEIVRLSFHETQEWHPSVDPDGRLVYTRWDYVDRDSDVAHHLWQCGPDGRDPRSLHGNYPERREARPWMELAIRAVPGAPLHLATAAPHHGQNYGSLVTIDLRRADDGAMSQVRRFTPEAHLPESESAPGVPHPPYLGRHTPPGELYGTAWPLSADFALCVLARDQRHYGLYLLDSFGNAEHLYHDPLLACLDPIPLRPRARPPVVPPPAPTAPAPAPGQAAPSARLFVANVYDSRQPWPAGTRLTRLRVLSVFPKPNSFADEPRVGAAPQSLARGVLGTVPVAADGSAYAEVPAGVGVYFQLLDERGLAVQSMQSLTYLHPGETLACVGCHAPAHRAPPARPAAAPLALRLPPATLEPGPVGSYPVAFPRLVQPVLNRHCLACHRRNAPKAPALDGTRLVQNGWSEAFASLQSRAWGRAGGNGAGMRYNGTSYSIPGRVGARASKLYPMLAAGHHDLRLPPEDVARISLWLDANSVFYGAYEREADQAHGQLVPPRWGWLPEYAR